MLYCKPPITSHIYRNGTSPYLIVASFCFSSAAGKENVKKGSRLVHLQILVWNDFMVQRLREETTYFNSINENHIEKFCAAKKQRIDSSY